MVQALSIVSEDVQSLVGCGLSQRKCLEMVDESHAKTTPLH